MIKKTYSKSSQKLSFESSLFSSLGACTFRPVILHQLSLRTIYDTLSLTNSTLCYSLVYKISCSNLWLSFPFAWKKL